MATFSKPLRKPGPPVYGPGTGPSAVMVTVSETADEITIVIERTYPMKATFKSALQFTKSKSSHEMWALLRQVASEDESAVPILADKIQEEDLWQNPSPVLRRMLLYLRVVGGVMPPSGHVP